MFLLAKPFESVYGDGPPPISDLRHPQYILNQENWEKWRLTYLGGSRFIKRYLKKLSRREDDVDFQERKQVTYCPAFAKSAINEVKNSIFQRIADVTRSGGPKTYQDAVSGNDVRGVDLLGSDMNTFMGRDILPELLVMARVGVYVDMPPLPGPTLADRGDKRPYLYWYKAEDIRSWRMNTERDGDPTDFRALLLRDSTYDVDAHWVLPYETTTRFRYLWIDPDDGFVHCRFYNQNGDYLNPNELGYDELFEGEDGEVILPIRKIPFVLLELTDSLMADIADYQIAHLNLASSDIAFTAKANFPFYTEQFDSRSESPHLRPAASGVSHVATHGTMQTTINPLTATAVVNQEKVNEVRVGVASGRRYPIGTERPAFIHPSSEPLQASMAKQEQMKQEIRQLIALAISNLQPRMQASAESKSMDNQGLEAGLSYIGLELQHAERKLANYWSMYENSTDLPTIRYPQNYSLLNDEDRREMADSLTKLLPHVPSLTFQREVAKKIAHLTLSTKISVERMESIESEIDAAPVVIGDPKVIEMDVQNGLCSLETASKARGYPDGEVEKAKQDHAERIQRIAEAQGQQAGQARGVPDLGSNPNAGKNEKQLSKDTTNDPEVTKKVRGEGKNVVQ